MFFYIKGFRENKLEVVNDRRDIEDGKGYKFIFTSVGDLSSI